MDRQPVLRIAKGGAGNLNRRQQRVLGKPHEGAVAQANVELAYGNPPV